MGVLFLENGPSWPSPMLTMPGPASRAILRDDPSLQDQRAGAGRGDPNGMMRRELRRNALARDEASRIPALGFPGEDDGNPDTPRSSPPGVAVRLRGIGDPPWSPRGARERGPGRCRWAGARSLELP